MTEAEEMRKYAESHGCGENFVTIPVDEIPVRPLPCVRDTPSLAQTKEQSLKKLFSKIDEELNELKEALFFGAERPMSVSAAYCRKTMYDEEKEKISEEAADTITAITTMLEALGIDAEMRDEAQRRVNNRNRERGRL